MMTGLGFTEVLTILVLVLLFFGSRELPRFVRQAAQLFAKLRQYGDKVRRELDEVSRSVDPVRSSPPVDTAAQRKKELRAKFLAARKALSAEQREEWSARVAEHVLSDPTVRDARAVMVYLHQASEVHTDGLVQVLRSAGKRIVVPYCRPHARDLGLAEITGADDELTKGQYGIREPVERIRDNFLKSDLDVVLCPGVAFDTTGGRIGHGKGYYDTFLRELSGRARFVGLAYSCQISEEAFPFDYHDVPMDQVTTETGPLMDKSAAES
jgi:5-formyltetrahydrofolate cyclo-ligase